MKKEQSINGIRRAIVHILRKNGVIRAGLFGSVARREAIRKSDVDILVRFRGRKSLFDLAGLELELEKKLGKKVDVITYKSLNPLIKERILKEEVVLI